MKPKARRTQPRLPAAIPSATRSPPSLANLKCAFLTQSRLFVVAQREQQEPQVTGCGPFQGAIADLLGNGELRGEMLSRFLKPAQPNGGVAQYTQRFGLTDAVPHTLENCELLSLEPRRLLIGSFRERYVPQGADGLSLAHAITSILDYGQHASQVLASLSIAA